MTFNREVKKGSMREVVANVFTILRKDEELMSILALTPEQLDAGYVINMNEDTEEYWELVDRHIKVTENSTNIEEEAVCRLYIYPGRRRPVFNNYLRAKQELIVDVFVHERFSADMRLEWINDRINELLALEYINGSFGKLDYAQGNGWVAPLGYTKYQHMFVFGANKK